VPSHSLTISIFSFVKPSRSILPLLSLLEKPSVPVENELRYRFYNRCYQTETNVTVYNTG